jgi:zinc transporter ZupT
MCMTAQLALLLGVSSSLVEAWELRASTGHLQPGDQPSALKVEGIQDSQWAGVIMPTIAAAATVIGALALLLVPDGEPPPWIMAFSLSLAAGLMVAVSVHMLTSTRQGSALTYVDVVVFLSGGLVCGLFCKGLRFFMTNDVEGEKKTDPDDGLDYSLDELRGKYDDVYDEQELLEYFRKSRRQQEETKKAPSQIGSIMLVTLCAHNIPEGAAVAIAASLTSPTLGIALMLAVALHNIPEGTALAIVLYRETGDWWQSFNKTVFCGCMELFGAFLALVFIQANQGTPQALILMLTAVAGVMCYVAVMEIFPEVIATKEWFAIVTGFVLSMGLYFLTMEVMRHYMSEGDTASALRIPGTNGPDWFI